MCLILDAGNREDEVCGNERTSGVTVAAAAVSISSSKSPNGIEFYKGLVRSSLSLRLSVGRLRVVSGSESRRASFKSMDAAFKFRPWTWSSRELRIKRWTSQ